jgi:uncharacterized membrane protein YkvA (DUF1232 family)
MGWTITVSLVAALLLAWTALLVTLILTRPRGPLLREAIRLLPDLLRLLHRMAGDATLPRGIRIQVGSLLAYLAFPIDLIPDVIPVLGYADDAIIVVVVLRSVVRRAGLAAVRAHWPGTPDGFAALCRLTGLPGPTGPPGDQPAGAPAPGPDPPSTSRAGPEP